MSARTELAKVIATHEQSKGSTTKLSKDWVFAQLDANSVRKAAVLILFGSATAEAVGENSKAQDLDLLFVERASTLRKHAGQVAFPRWRCGPGGRFSGCCGLTRSMGGDRSSDLRD
ncbi:MAG: hypothetical protein ACTH2A_06210 [Glutamicibacter ardleyensis]